MCLNFCKTLLFLYSAHTEKYSTQIQRLVVGFLANLWTRLFRFFFTKTLHLQANPKVVQSNYFLHSISSPKVRTAASIILRAANDFYCDEMERSVHDALCVVKRVMESKQVVPGGGCVEAALSIYLENFATSVGSREQLAIAEFANALLVIPKCLAVNAAKDSTDLTAKLRAYHNNSQLKPDQYEKLKW
jgi:chaperonin GroEL (HSP60 family)